MSLAILEPRRAVEGLIGRCALGVMFKAPRPGQSKTRLCPPLRPEQAAELSQCFFRDTTANIALACRKTDRAVGVAIYTPAGSENEFAGAVPPDFFLIPQRGSDFGQRLLNALTDLLSVGFSSVALIDSDSPSLPTDYYEELIDQLAGAPADRLVLGPTEDGGYYLIGVTRIYPALFTDIDWSTERVFRQTLRKASELRLRVVTLGEWYDVDNAASLERLMRELTSRSVTQERSRYPAPITLKFLERWRSLENAAGKFA